MRHPVKLALLCSIWIFSSPLLALEDDRNQPIELLADSVDFDDSKGLSIYTGDVDLRQGSMRLWADKVTVQHRDKKPDKIIAVGSPARFQQDGEDGPVKARAKHADYVVDSELLILTGDAVLQQRGDEVKNDRIIYDRVKHRIKAGGAAQGKQRVRITIQPPEK